MLPLLLALPALAGDPTVTAVGEPFRLLEGGGGTWVRLIPHTPVEDPDAVSGSPEEALAQSEWVLLMSHNSDLYWRALDSDLNVIKNQPTDATQDGTLTDHAIAPCPDGGFIDAASSTTTHTDDTLKLFRFDSEMNLVASRVIEDYPSLVFADAPAACTEGFTATGGFMFREEEGVPESLPLFILDTETLETTELLSVDSLETWFGAAILEDPVTGHVISIRSGADGPGILTTLHDRETGATLDQWVEDLGDVDAGDRAFWPGTITPFGNHWLMPILLGDDPSKWKGDGDLALVIFDEDFIVRSLTQITDYGETPAAMQPWVAVKGHEVVMSYTHQNGPWAVRLELEVPPVADAGADQEVAVGETAVLDGSASYDPDGDDLEYRWSLWGAPEGSTAELSSAGSDGAVLVPDLPGTYAVYLTVSDGSEADVDLVDIVATGDSGSDGGGEDGGGDGSDDAGSSDDGSDAGGDEASGGGGGGGGCGGGSAAVLPLVLSLAGLRRRRRDPGT